MLEEVNQLPRKLVKDIDGTMGRLGVYLVQDFNLKLLRRMVNFGLNIFGELGMDEWGLVPQIRHGNVYVLKEKDKPQVIGLAIFMRDWDEDDKVYLFDYAIKEDLQGHGLGFEFLRGIAENLVDQGYRTMSLTVDVENKPAIRLYKDKIGFEIIEFKENEYGEGHDRYYMEWDMKKSLDEKNTQ
jgi:ribosomal-protein-alanine N-acetyltransferase